MSDDILARLRHWANGAAEQEVQDVVDALKYAADEIERLRRNTGCARNQRSTQFCAEALDAQREIERLREERDYVRRLLCIMLSKSPRKAAREIGWDCFSDNAGCRSNAPPANTGGGADHQIPEAL
jgi:hypothetical protein